MALAAMAAMQERVEARRAARIEETEAWAEVVTADALVSVGARRVEPQRL